MKVLMLNGSPHAKGNTYTALHQMEQVFIQSGVEVELLHIGSQDIRGCIGCRKCAQLGRCVFDDLVNETAPKLEACDGETLTVDGAAYPRQEVSSCREYFDFTSIRREQPADE